MPTLTPTPAALARRLLLAAWAIDDDRGLTPAERTWLQQRLADRDWMPTVPECTRFRLRLLAWARRYGETALVIQVLVPVSPFLYNRGCTRTD